MTAGVSGLGLAFGFGCDGVFVFLGFLALTGVLIISSSSEKIMGAGTLARRAERRGRCERTDLEYNYTEKGCELAGEAGGILACIKISQPTTRSIINLS